VTVEIHSDWTTTGFDHPPVAEFVGPFAGPALLRAWWDIRGRGELAIVEGPGALMALEIDDDTVRFVGEADLFDYHTPRGLGVAKVLTEWARTLPAGTTVEFDSLPGEAADPIAAGLEEAGLSPTAEVHESAAIVELPPDYEEYLAQLDKKQRHETRRKNRRFTEAIGVPRLQRQTGDLAVARFAAMHRLAEGEKGSFMSAEMEQLFASFHGEAGAVVDFLYGEGPEPVAAAFGFEDTAAYYLYNSAYDPGEGAASPGIVLVAELIRQALESGKDRFDFLKGDEIYKYRLGASARPLWRLSASVRGAS